MAKRPVTTLLETVWSNAQAATDHSWERLNTAMRRALGLAIGAGFEFKKADFEGLDKFRYGYWISADQEWVYSMAIAETNYSAATAYEEWVKREPIIADNVRPGSGHVFAHMVGDRVKERLHVGCHFEWQGEKVKVTSFNDEGAAIACSYHPAEGQYDHERKVKRRYCITREVVIQERAERKQREAAIAEFIKLKEGGAVIDFAKEFGVKTTREVRAMPFKKFERIAERIKQKVKQAA